MRLCSLFNTFMSKDFMNFFSIVQVWWVPVTHFHTQSVEWLVRAVLRSTVKTETQYQIYCVKVELTESLSAISSELLMKPSICQSVNNPDTHCFHQTFGWNNSGRCRQFAGNAKCHFRAGCTGSSAALFSHVGTCIPFQITECWQRDECSRW